MLYTLNSIIIAAATRTTSSIPDPGRGTAPPGSDGIVKIIGWAAWIAVGVCVVGVLIAGSKMALEHRRGGGGESVASLGWVLGGCIVIGSASAIVGALV